MRAKLSKNKGRRKILVTGGAGFIGSEFARQGERNGYELVVVDTLTYAADLARLNDCSGRYKFYKCGLGRRRDLELVFQKERPRMVVNFAAETHVDRSIQNASVFVETNICGTQNLLDFSRQYGVERFMQISTDEVYGEIKKGHFVEDSPLSPNSPYAASKASADLLVKAYIRTHGFPAIIARPSNNYGPWQYPEKLVPVVILKALKNQAVPVYAQGENVREWLFVSDCVRAILLILEKGKTGETYNIGSGQEKRNIDTVKNILGLLGKSEKLICYVQDRPGHDFRYALDCAKIKGLGWQPQVDFDEGMSQAVSWYKQNLPWLESKLKSLSGYWKKVYKKA